MADKLRVRLDRDVLAMVEKVGKRNSRTVPAEVNHVLREYYTEELSILRGVGPGEPMPPVFTRLDPTPRTDTAWTPAPLELSFGATKKSYPKMAAFAKKMTKRYNGK